MPVVAVVGIAVALLRSVDAGELVLSATVGTGASFFVAVGILAFCKRAVSVRISEQAYAGPNQGVASKALGLAVAAVAMDNRRQDWFAEFKSGVLLLQRPEVIADEEESQEKTPEATKNGRT